MKYTIIECLHSTQDWFQTIVCKGNSCTHKATCRNKCALEEKHLYIIDLKNVQMATSLFFAELIWCVNRGNHIVLVNLNPRVKAVFEILNLTTIVKTAPNIDAVLKNLDYFY